MARQITYLTITKDRSRLALCSGMAEAPQSVWDGLLEHGGERVAVFLPPLPKPSGIGTPCSSRYFWQLADEEDTWNAPGCACFCEHMVELD
jgi:hypothetical protein